MEWTITLISDDAEKMRKVVAAAQREAIKLGDVQIIE